MNTDSCISLNKINEPKIFTYDEAVALLPILILISTKTKRELNKLNSQLQFVKNDSDKSSDLHTRISSELAKWSNKVQRLGGKPVSLCRVQILGKNTNFYWEYPQTKLVIDSR